MITLTYGSKSVSIHRNCDPTSKHWLERINHFSRQTVSGSVVTYDSGITILHGVLIARFVDHAEAIALRDFINDDLRYTLRQFSLSANSCDDLGLGKGEGLTICKLDGVSDTGAIMEPRGIGDKWDVRIPYVCKLNGSGGLGDI